MAARPAPLAWRLQVHDVLPSTQDLAIARAEAGEPEGLAVLARRQSTGRGRDGRGWDSSAGNLFLSVLLRPAAPARATGQWGLLAALAVAEAAAPLLPDPDALALKWPNDVLLGGGKLAGILTSASTAPDGRLAWIVFGIGVNLAQAPELPDRPTASLAGAGARPPAPEVFAGALLSALDRWRRIWLRDGFGPVREAWLRRGPRPETEVAVRLPEGPLSGRFAGLGEDGALLLATAEGLRSVRTGEGA